MSKITAKKERKSADYAEHTSLKNHLAGNRRSCDQIDCGNADKVHRNRFEMHLIWSTNGWHFFFLGIFRTPNFNDFHYSFAFFTIPSIICGPKMKVTHSVSFAMHTMMPFMMPLQLLVYSFFLDLLLLNGDCKMESTATRWPSSSSFSSHWLHRLNDSSWNGCDDDNQLKNKPVSRINVASRGKKSKRDFNSAKKKRIQFSQNFRAWFQYKNRFVARAHWDVFKFVMTNYFVLQHLWAQKNGTIFEIFDFKCAPGKCVRPPNTYIQMPRQT